MQIRFFRKFASLALVTAILAVAGCGGDSSSGSDYRPATAPRGVIFTYPMDGQSDVHLGTRFYATFSKSVSESAVNQTCGYSAGEVTGNFCLLDSDNNVVSITPAVRGRTIEFESAQLQQGSDYRLYVRNAVIGGGRTNLPGTLSSDDPLIEFRTSQNDPVAGTAPEVLTINGESPDNFATSAARYPFLDYSTLRISFTEPLRESTVVLRKPGESDTGQSFRFVLVNGPIETPVAGAMVVHGQHIIFDPDEDLIPGATYRLYLTNAITDRNGTSLAAAFYEVVPQKADACDCFITSKFNLTAALGDSNYPQNSRLTGTQLNRAEFYSPLTGTNFLEIRDTTFLAELADPSAFGTQIPFVIRKGAFLDVTGMPILLGGLVDMNQNTGEMKVSFASDVIGFISRNPYYDQDIIPDDTLSPLFVSLTFDLTLSTLDATGNAMLSQLIPNVQALGTARIANGQLLIETVRSLEVNALGLDRAALHLVLGFQSDVNATVPADQDIPALVASYPADGSEGFAVRDNIQLIFSEGMDSSGISAADQITLTNLDTSASVPFQLEWDGSTIMLNPESPLNFGDQYEVAIVDTLTSVGGNDLVLSGTDASGGDGVISFITEAPDVAHSVPPVVTSIHKGIPCYLSDASFESPGFCRPLIPADEPYNPIVIPANGRIEVDFNQPMDTATLTLGAACGTGAIRIERVDASAGDNCLEPVAGTLYPDTRGFRFVPNANWVEGERYKLTLVGSATGANNDNACTVGEICGANGAPLNTNPKRGATATDGGGPNIVNVFEVSAASDERLLPLTLDPITDSNGNGVVDAGETGYDDNSAEMNILGISGIVTSAVIDGNNKVYLSGSLPVTINPAVPLSIDGADWGMTLAGTHQTPIELHPGILYGTSIRLDSTAEIPNPLLFPPTIALDIPNVDTGMTIMRSRQIPGEPIYGYIVEEDGVDEPQFILQLELYFDAPDMNITVIGGLITVGHNLNSYPISVTLKGPVTFMADGRLKIDLANVYPVDIDVELSSIAGPGGINMQISAGTMQIQLFGDPLRGRL